MSNDFGTFNKAARSNAAERNKVPISEVFVPLLKDSKPGIIVELACGTGQHAAHLASELPNFTFQPTDLDDSSFDAVLYHTKDCANVKAPMVVDATDSNWSDNVLKTVELYTEVSDKEIASVLIINMTHISPFAATLGALRGSSDLLRKDGLLFIYGPFKRDGKHTSEGNATFDESLQKQKAQWGYRDIESVIENGKSFGFGNAEITEMPANNFVLTMRKQLL